MNRRITAYAIGLVLAFAAGRMTIGAQPIESRSIDSPTTEARTSLTAEPLRLVPVCEPLCVTSATAAPTVSDSDRQSASALEQAIAELDAAGVGNDEALQLHALHELWIAAADAGAPTDALDALEGIRDAPRIGERFQRVAGLALEDLDRLMKTRTDSPGWVDPVSESFDLDRALAQVPDSDGDPHSNATLFDRFALDLDDPEPIVRLDAVRGLALHRSEEVLQILLRAVHDIDTGVRLETVRSLWVVAADGFDRDEQIVRSLEYASRDRDDRVRAVAEHALEDLARLAR